MRIKRYYLAVVLFVITLVVPLRSVESRESNQIHFAYFNAPLASVFVSYELGLFPFPKNNLVLVPFGNQPQNILPAVKAGKIDGGYTATSRIISAISTGFQVRIVGVADLHVPKKSGLVIVGQTNLELRSEADLRNKRIGVLLAGPEEFMIDKLLEMMGVQRNEVELFNLDLGEKLIALKKGTIDIAVLNTMYALIAVREGVGRVLMDGGQIIPDFSTTAIFFSNHFAKDNPSLISKFMDGIYRGGKYVNNPPNAKEVATIISKYTGQDKSLLENMVIPFQPETPRLPSEKEIGNLMDWMKKRGYLTRSISYENIVYKNLNPAIRREK